VAAPGAGGAAGKGLSIVVVTWRSARDLERLIGSMTEHLGHGTELIVVDNASGDDVAARASAWPGPRRFIPLDSNLGFGAAANCGIEAAEGEATVLLNPDTELVDRSLPELARYALERRALAGPRVLEPDGSPQPSASGPPVGAWPWLGAVVPGAVQPSWLLARTEPWRLERTVRVAWLAGSCVAAPRDVLLSLGPFDRAIHLYGEDMDLGLRAARSGVPSLFCPEVARVIHRGRGSTSQRLPDGPWELIARNRRAVLGRAFGARRERAAQGAHLLNLALRAAAKRALGRDASRDRAAFRAAIKAPAKWLDPGQSTQTPGG